MEGTKTMKSGPTETSGLVSSPAPQASFYMGDGDKLSALYDTMERCLQEKGIPNGGDQFHDFLNDIDKPEVPAAALQSKLERLVDMADDEGLRATFASFLNAPLDTDREKDTALVQLHYTIGLQMGGPRVNETSFELMGAARDLWHRNHLQKLRDFTAKFVNLGSTLQPDQYERKRQDLEAMAEGDVKLRLHEYFVELEKAKEMWREILPDMKPLPNARL